MSRKNAQGIHKKPHSEKHTHSHGPDRAVKSQYDVNEADQYVEHDRGIKVPAQTNGNRK